ncbi:MULTISPECIES: PAS domain S-box protein [Halorussus]|uniref:PAS domain S-box protein n=1 Tax=Halorussus TaxID=1070314 RepID=UPI0020A1BEBA|nr:PAS domain S-box protein [Halorussus vallis]USZ75009.1 PAS domain S-box protein [Halorussus vallis]
MSVPNQTDLRRHREVITKLGQRAIEADNLDQLLRDAASTITQTLDTTYCGVFELLPDKNVLHLRQGVGWAEALVGTATIHIDCDSGFEDVLTSAEPIIVIDDEDRSHLLDSEVFATTEVVGGVTVSIGDTDNPWGILGVFTSEEHDFADHNAEFVQSVANLLSTAIDERTAHHLHDEEALKSKIVETVNDGVYAIDEDGRFTTVNKAYCEMTGYSRNELLGSYATLVIDEEVLQQGSEMRTAMLKGEVDNPTIEAELQTATGDRIPVEGTFAMLPDAADSAYQRIGVVRDITERKERERALLESERRYRTLVENFPNGAVGLFDQNLRYTAVGGQLVEATGLNPEDRIGSSVHEIYPDELVEEVEPHFYAALEGEANSFEVEYHDRHLLAYTLPIRDADNEVFAGMLVVQDVTDRMEYQRQLEESNARLKSFASMLAHELRNPLQIAQIYLQQIADGDGRALNEVNEALTRIEDTIDILMMLSKGIDKIPPAETVTLVTQAEEAWSTTATNGAELIVDTTQAIHGKPTYLRHLFENLFRNAIEHAGESVTIRVGDLDDGFFVEDNGLGIPADEREAVFQAGFSSDTQGTGLGLTLVAQIADAYGWEYSVTESATGGARFEFTNVNTVDREES